MTSQSQYVGANLPDLFAAASAVKPTTGLLSAGFWNLVLVGSQEAGDVTIELEDEGGSDAGAIYFKLLDLTMAKRAEKEGHLLGPELIDRAQKILDLLDIKAKPVMVTYGTATINGDLYIP